jgi:putative MATE family efflux protein
MGAMENQQDNSKTPPKEKMGRDLTTGSIPRHIIAFSTPMLIGSAFQTLYAFINMFWVGTRLGKESVAVITQIMPINFALMSIAIGLTTASAILVAQAYGRKDFGGIKDIIRSSVMLSLIASVLCIVVSSLVAEPLLRTMQTPAGILQESVYYMRVFMWTLPCVFIGFLMASILRGVGDSITPLYFQIISLIITAVLDPLLIFGWMGCPKLGLIGTAYANIIAQVVGVAALSIYLDRKKHIARLHWDSLGMHWATCNQLLRLGVPTMFQNAFVSLAMVFLTGLVNVYGETADAAFGIAGRWDMVAFMPAITMQMAISTLAGQNIGAGRFDRIKEVFLWGMVLTCGMTLIATIIAVSVPEFIMRGFTKDAEVVRIGVDYLRIMGLSYVLFAMMFVSNGIINGAGHTMATTIFSLLALWLIRVPLAAYWSHHTGNITGIWYSILVSAIAGVIASLIYYFAGFWKKPVGHRKQQPVVEAD